MYWASIRRLIIPVVLLIVASTLRDKVATLQPAYGQLMQYMPYILFAVVAALSLYYNRARLFTAALSLLLIYYLIQTQLQTTLTEQNALLVYSLVSVFHPVSLLALLLVSERGLLNRYGLYLQSTLALAIFLAVFLGHYYSAPVMMIINNWLPIKPMSGLILSLPASTCYLFAMVVALYRLIIRNDDFALMIFSIALFSFVTLALLNLPNISAVMLSAVAISLIIAIMATSYDMAYRDDLTGLLGRRALNDRMRGLAGQYVMAMMDVDHFKKFNDTHGHDIGDEVLKMVAKQIGAVAGGGTAYRYGGEEFCVVFAGKDIEDAQPVLEDVRRNIEHYQMKVRDNRRRPKSKETAEQRRGRRAKNRNDITVSVTISIGIAESGNKQDIAESVLKAADKALYKAKNKGRNCLAY